MVYNIALGLGLGKFGVLCGKENEVNKECDCKSGEILLAVLSLYKHFRCEDYLELALRISSNILSNGFYKNCFVSDKNRKYAHFDCVEPLAILSLCETLASKENSVPPYISGSGYIHGKYKMEDGTVEAYTTHKLYEQIV